MLQVAIRSNLGGTESLEFVDDMISCKSMVC